MAHFFRPQKVTRSVALEKLYRTEGKQKLGVSFFNIGWPKSHFTVQKIEYLCYGLSKRADLFATDKGVFIVHIH